MSGGYDGDDLTGLWELVEERSDPLDGWRIGPTVATMVPLLAALSALQMVSGAVLESFEATLLANPSLLILVPVQIGTAGNLGSIICARLSTQLHLGTVELTLDEPVVRANAAAVLGLGVTVFTIVGVAAWALGGLFGGTLGLGAMLTIALGSGSALSVVVVILSVLAVRTSDRLGYDPNDTTIPVVTNACDVAGVLILLAVAGLVV